jgi:hypothetical protein
MSTWSKGGIQKPRVIQEKHGRFYTPAASIFVVSRRKRIYEWMNLSEEELRKLAAKQLKWGRKLLAKERAARGVRTVQ